MRLGSFHMSRWRPHMSGTWRQSISTGFAKNKWTRHRRNDAMAPVPSINSVDQFNGPVGSTTSRRRATGVAWWWTSFQAPPSNTKKFVTASTESSTISRQMT